jgi:glutamate synthase domain-containing protein 2
MKAREIFIVVSISLLILIIAVYFIWQPIIWSLLVVGPLTLIGLLDVSQKKHAILRNFPIIGHFRYILEKFRPEIMQYFVETDTEGKPIDRLHRSLIYRRAKKVNDTTPFGTQLDVYKDGYEWMEHTIYTEEELTIDEDPRVVVGGKNCLKPYAASVLNISAMSYGSLSNNAILALNKGAKIGGFAHNTGEGGISDFHIQSGGDLIWQIGTGYFGCRTEDGNFSPELFKEKAQLDNVKMIEIKISQGAKPGHGGILPAIKNTEEIAKIRHVKPHTDVISPSRHKAFKDSEGLLKFVQQLRELSGGKPIGFKLCIGKEEEFTDICKTMIKTNIKPDFITIDGGEGGTGAAPVEFSNSLGMPLLDALVFAVDNLRGYGLKKEIKVIASGKVLTGFHIARALSLGADMVNSARAMMMALGCIQALQCNTNTCPVGVATQNKSLIKGLDVNDKSVRVANFHKSTIKSFVELLDASGINNPQKLTRKHINKRINMNQALDYSQIYPVVEEGAYLNQGVLL